MELALKNLGVLVLLLLTLSVVPRAQSQVKKRTAVLRSGSPFPWAEQNIADQLITLLVEGGKVEVVDRAQMAQIFNEQNMQNNLYYNPQQPRFSAESAVYLGKLLGVPALVFVRVDAYSREQRPPVNSGKKHTISGNVALKATAQIVNVETGSIFAAPTASFDQERILSEWTDGHRAFSIGPVPVPQGKGTQGADPQVALRKLTDEALNSVEQNLAEKVANAIQAAQNLSARAQKMPKVAGVQQGTTFLNEGSTSGVKVGDMFQIIRVVESGMVDPDTQKPILRKKQVCLLTISEVEESLASGKCVGDLALSGDQAIAQSR